MQIQTDAVGRDTKNGYRPSREQKIAKRVQLRLPTASRLEDTVSPPRSARATFQGQGNLTQSTQLALSCKAVQTSLAAVEMSQARSRRKVERLIGATTSLTQNFEQDMVVSSEGQVEFDTPHTYQ